MGSGVFSTVLAAAAVTALIKGLKKNEWGRMFPPRHAPPEPNVIVHIPEPVQVNVGPLVLISSSPTQFSSSRSEAVKMAAAALVEAYHASREAAAAECEAESVGDHPPLETNVIVHISEPVQVNVGPLVLISSSPTQFSEAANMAAAALVETYQAAEAESDGAYDGWL